MITEENLNCLKVYKQFLEDYGDDVAYVNETSIHSEKAIVVTLLCIDFTTEDKYFLHNTCLIQFCVPKKLCWENHCNGANRKIPKWIALKNLEKCIELKTTNLCK